MNLKSTDLMIGNYVKVKTSYIEFLNDKKDYTVKESEIIRQVDAYLLESLMKQEQGIIKENVYGYLYVEPIPLTDEIMIENGFVREDGEIWACSCPEDKEYNFEVTKSKNRKYYYWSINLDEYKVLRLDYVHELQQATHLCRINKNFVL